MTTTQVQYRRGTAAQLAAFTPAAGEVVVDTSNNRLSVGDGVTLGGWPAAKLADLNTGAGYFFASNPATVILKPYNGDNIRIAGVGYKIPAGSVSAISTNCTVNGSTGQVIGASKLYYAYAYSTGGALAIDFSTTTHATDVTAGNVGTEIKNADNSRTLVGMVYTSSTSAFVDNAQARQTLSWFNRQNKEINFSAGAALSTSTSFSPTSTAPTATMLNWVGEAINLVAFGNAQFGSTSSSQFGQISVTLDLSTVPTFETFLYPLTFSFSYPASVGGWTTPSEGLHAYSVIASLVASTSGATAALFNIFMEGVVRG